MKDGKVSRQTLEHMRLVDSIKGIDMANYERLAKDSGVPVELIINAAYELSTEPLDLAQLDERIAYAEEHHLAPEYISGLKDARKLVRMAIKRKDGE